jgi:glucose-6-phosphate 1-dehydrogenase
MKHSTQNGAGKNVQISSSMRSGGERLAAIPPGVKGRKIFSALYDGRHRRQIRPRTHVREFFSRKVKCKELAKVKKPSLSEIEQSLIEQLEQMGASVDFYKSLVSDYLFYEKQERKMQADIRKRGLTYMAVSAVGKEYEKDNPSVKQAYMYNKQKLQILKDLGLSTDKVKNLDDDEEL